MSASELTEDISEKMNSRDQRNQSIVPQDYSDSLGTNLDVEGESAVDIGCQRQRSSFFRRDSLLRAAPDLSKIKEYLQECIVETQQIHVPFYILSYKEIIKFLRALGTLLSFASRDLEQKVALMEEHLASEFKANYQYLDKLIQFELQLGLVDKQGRELKRSKISGSGTRIMFRLHQALAFLITFFNNVKTMSEAKMHAIVNEAYKATISKNHSWLVRKTATLAFHAIPSRNSLISRLGEKVDETLVMQHIGDIVAISRRVYAQCNNTFREHSRIANNEPSTV